MTTLPIENIPCVTLLVISVITLQSTTRRFDPFIVVTLAIIAFAHFFYVYSYSNYFTRINTELKTYREILFLSSLKFSSTVPEAQVECSICFEPIEKTNDGTKTSTTLRCQCSDRRVYHFACIKKWFTERQNTCPFCRITFY